LPRSCPGESVSHNPGAHSGHVLHAGLVEKRQIMRITVMMPALSRGPTCRGTRDETPWAAPGRAVFRWPLPPKWLLSLALALMAQFNLRAGLPDLIINSNTVNPSMVTQTFSSSDCSVAYGCVSPGTRTLLEFTTEVWNIGDADLVLGNPTNNPLFYYSPCNGRYYFKDCAVYNLLDTHYNVVVPGHKASFCIGDDFQWNPGAKTNPVYNCSYQGLQQGWVDDYPAGVPCQWIDITGVPSGNYLLQLIINPENLVQESNTNNNTLFVAVSIPVICQAPPNDSFANAQVLPAAIPQSISANNHCATTEPSEPWINNIRGGASVWFSWTPATSQVVNLTTLGSDFSTLLAVYTGASISTISQVAIGTNVGSGSLQSALTFSAAAGTDYRITVDGANGAQGLIQLNFNAPPNDMFANCHEISGPSGTVYGSSVGATKEPGEPAHDGNPGGHSVWYYWTAPTSGIEVIDTIGSDFDTVLAVYTGDTVSYLTSVASDNDSGGDKTSRVSFHAAAGTTYHIAVDGFAPLYGSAPSGSIQLNWNPPCRLTINVAASPRQLNLAGAFGLYAVQSSIDLLHWQTFTNFYLGQSSFAFTDARNLAAAYYRAVLMPSP
jgi:hypothetical protein